MLGVGGLCMRCGQRHSLLKSQVHERNGCRDFFFHAGRLARWAEKSRKGRVTSRLKMLHDLAKSLFKTVSE